MNSETIEQVVYSAIDDLNQLREEDQQIAKSCDTEFFGEQGVLDSLALVSLLVSIETKVQDQFGVAVTLANEQALSQNNSPFQNVKTLVEHTCGLLQEECANG